MPALVFGVGLFALAAQQAQQVQKPPIKKKIENLDIPVTQVGSITITNPTSNSGPWFAGYFGRNITWTKIGGQPDNVKIELRNASCTGGVLVIAESTPNNGLHYWTIPESLAPGPYTIRISGGNVQRCSDQFQIHRLPYKITVPSGTWKIGTTHTITWTSTQPASTLVRLGLPFGVKQVSQRLACPFVPDDRESCRSFLADVRDRVSQQLGNPQYRGRVLGDSQTLDCHDPHLRVRVAELRPQPRELRPAGTQKKKRNGQEDTETRGNRVHSTSPWLQLAHHAQ